MSTVSNPAVLGADLSAANSAGISALSTDGLTLGTKAYNQALGATFTLTVSTASPVTDQILVANGLSNGRWILDTVTIPAGSIGTTQLANSAVTTAKIAASAVTTALIADANVTTAKIAASAVTTALIADANVTNAKQANMAAGTVKSNLTGGAAAPSDNTVDAVMDALATSTHPSYQVYESAEIDLSTTDAGGVTVLLPAKPGFFPYDTLLQFVITQKAGTLSTQPVFSIGAEATTYADFSASATVSFATAFTAGVGSSAGVVSQTLPRPSYSHTTPTYFKQTVAAAGTGGFVLKGKFVIAVTWLPNIT